MSRIAVILLTKNEELHIARALACVQGLAHSIHVVDSGSTDRTCEIAQALGAEVLTHRWKNYADQFQWACDNISTDAEWLLRLDADELVEADLAATIEAELPKVAPDVAGIIFDRKHIFMGRWIRHGGRYPLRLLRLFRRGRGRIEQRWMDEHILVDGPTVHFAGGFADHNLNNLTFFTTKHNGYATREALDALIERHQLLPRQGDEQPLNLQARVKRFIKLRIYNRLPFYLSASGYFFYRYILQLGFLDGVEGLCYHFLQGYWYRLLVGAKVLEMERELTSLPTRDAKLAKLENLTGHRLREEAAT
jgi:glycosyltransferase involved in cell wall biosynthesis